MAAQHIKAKSEKLKRIDRKKLSSILFILMMILISGYSAFAQPSADHEKDKATLLDNLKTAKTPDEINQQTKLLSKVINEEPQLIKGNKMVRDALTTMAQRDPSILKDNIGLLGWIADVPSNKIMKNWLDSYGVKLAGTTFGAKLPSGQENPIVKKISKKDGTLIADFDRPPISLPLEGIAGHNPVLASDVLLIGDVYTLKGTIRIKGDKLVYLTGTEGVLSSPDDPPLANFRIEHGSVSIEEIRDQVREHPCPACDFVRIRGKFKEAYQIEMAPGLRFALSEGISDGNEREYHVMNGGLYYLRGLPSFGLTLDSNSISVEKQHIEVSGIRVGTYFPGLDNSLLHWTITGRSSFS